MLWPICFAVPIYSYIYISNQRSAGIPREGALEPLNDFCGSEGIRVVPLHRRHHGVGPSPRMIQTLPSFPLETLLDFQFGYYVGIEDVKTV